MTASQREFGRRYPDQTVPAKVTFKKIYSEVCLNLLQEQVEEYLEYMPVVLNLRIIWQQDGAPPHNVRPVRNYLN
ncbi:hypothetical protein NQ318_004800 [Aromia moschata]|uniref:DUF4817 domain-containing protein n=1 Tax=Aromia moschata TaxID=1265417 RepID=A0AAV8XNH9_9CUCU|nr:hypothetical protein NQ318_004800 [Aromia moschata]